MMVIPTSAEDTETEEVSIRETSVLDDLKSSTQDGIPFDFERYKYNEAGTVQLLNFVEYKYSYRSNQRDEFGLFLYIYNPALVNIVPNSTANKVQMATKFDAAGNPTDYEKFPLRYIDSVTEGEYIDRFYKFEIVDQPLADGSSFLDRLDTDARKYCISGIELLTDGNMNATDYPVSATFIFTGFSKGYGYDPEVDNLACDSEALETVQLDVKHTFYRTKTSSKGGGYQNQIDSVYFAVPKSLFDKYGTLQRIKAEWYEYKTKDIIVTSNSDVYNKIKQYVGMSTGPYNEYGMTEYIEGSRYGFGENMNSGGGLSFCSWGWNLGSEYLHPAMQYMYYLFLGNDIDTYDPYADIVESGGVQSNALYQHILNYNKTFNSGRLPIKDGTISADLFESDIDDYRKIDNELGKIGYGYSYYDFDASIDLGTLESWSSTDPSFWDDWINFGFWNALTGEIPDEVNQNVSPIIILKASDLSGTDEEIAERLLVNYKDVPALKAYYHDAVTQTSALDEEKVVVLFRFAISDYFSTPISIYDHSPGLFGSNVNNGMAYRAKESVFLDFDIIQLTFLQNGIYHVIPVVSNPIDIIDDITVPTFTNDDSSYRALIALILVILLIICLWPFIGGFVTPILTTIVQAIGFLMKSIVSILLVPFKIGGEIRRQNKEKRKIKKQKERERAKTEKQRLKDEKCRLKKENRRLRKENRRGSAGDTAVEPEPTAAKPPTQESPPDSATKKWWQFVLPWSRKGKLSGNDNSDGKET